MCFWTRIGQASAVRKQSSECQRSSIPFSPAERASRSLEPLPLLDIRTLVKTAGNSRNTAIDLHSARRLSA